MKKTLFVLLMALFPLCAMAQERDVELPICQAVHAVLYESAEPGEAMSALFTRSLKREF